MIGTKKRKAICDAETFRKVGGWIKNNQHEDIFWFILDRGIELDEAVRRVEHLKWAIERTSYSLTRWDMYCWIEFLILKPYQHDRYNP